MSIFKRKKGKIGTWFAKALIAASYDGFSIEPQMKKKKRELCRKKLFIPFLCNYVFFLFNTIFIFNII